MTSALNKAITDALEVAETRRLTKVMDEIIERNMELTPTPIMGFIHQGLSYRHTQAPMGKVIYPELHVQLTDDMSSYLTSKGNIKSDLQLISQALFPIIRLSTSQQDLRDGLPDCLVSTLMLDVAKLPRTRPPAFMLEEGSRAHQTYQRVLPKIEFFTAARLLY